jgi:hypothetical protein
MHDHSVLVAGTEVALPHRAADRVAHGAPVVLGASPEYLEFSTHPVARSFQGEVGVVGNLWAARRP